MHQLENKVFCVTGGTGSFGKTMVKELLRTKAAEIRVLSRDEAKQDQMRHDFSDDRVQFFLGDVRDLDSLSAPFFGVDHVFHAAALKQVPSAEFFPREAVKTNVLGSENVLTAALRAQVKSTVCLSTDKAVYPINAMGMTKALMEKTAVAFARSNPNSMTVSITRYGNVMMSRGSVIPLFIAQIRNGKPLSITNPEMTRFLMSLDESVDLVKFAFNEGETGSTYVKKAPAATIETLARAVCILFEVPYDPIIIGPRHGEKLYETLLSEEESFVKVDMGDFFKIPMDVRGLDYAQYFETGISETLESAPFHSHNAKRLSEQEVADLLMELPEIRAEVENWRSSK
jgi:UDP-N-acetylglucosamine 4,6-dehydratase